MFDLGFGELMLIAVVALVVLGPERLPKAARFAGVWVRRARAQWHSVKGELERELAAEELKRNLHDARTAARDLDGAMRSTGDDIRRKLEATRDEVRRDLEATREEALDGLAPRATPPAAITPTDNREADAPAPDPGSGADGVHDPLHPPRDESDDGRS
jgi:sec-independent protein translocase protein TatB